MMDDNTDHEAEVKPGETAGFSGLVAAENDINAAPGSASHVDASGNVSADPTPVSAPPSLPPATHPHWDEFKAWIRKEIGLSKLGHSEETRAVLNP